MSRCVPHSGLQAVPACLQGVGAWGIVVSILAFYNGAADLFVEMYGWVSSRCLAQAWPGATHPAWTVRHWQPARLPARPPARPPAGLPPTCITTCLLVHLPAAGGTAPGPHSKGPLGQGVPQGVLQVRACWDPSHRLAGCGGSTHAQQRHSLVAAHFQSGAPTGNVQGHVEVWGFGSRGWAMPCPTL